MEILWKCEKKENYFDGNVMELWKCEIKKSILMVMFYHFFNKDSCVTIKDN